MPRGEEPHDRAQQAASDAFSFWLNKSNQVRVLTQQQVLCRAGQLVTHIIAVGLCVWRCAFFCLCGLVFWVG